MLIGCIPVKYHPTVPDDQSTPITQEDCPECGEKMWVSRKKRELRDKGIPCMCMLCVVAEMDGVEHDVIDINNRH